MLLLHLHPEALLWECTLPPRPFAVLVNAVMSHIQQHMQKREARRLPECSAHHQLHPGKPALGETFTFTERATDNAEAQPGSASPRQADSGHQPEASVAAAI